MFDLRKMLHVARFAAVFAAALAISACANKTGEDAQANAAGQATPGSQQDFVVNVGDRVFFETDSSELTPQSRATLDKQAQWLTTYSQYGQFTVEGHADERGTREYNIALGARRAQAVRDYLVSRGIQAPAHAHDILRQGTAGRGLQRHFLLVAEPPRGHRARRKLVSARQGQPADKAGSRLASFEQSRRPGVEPGRR